MDPRSDDAPGRLEVELLRQYDRMAADIERGRRAIMRRLMLLGSPRDSGGIPCASDVPFEALTHTVAITEEQAEERDEPPGHPL